MSGKEVSQWGNVLGLPLSSLRTGGNPVLCSVPENLPLGADAGLLMLQPGSWLRCRNVLRVIWSVLRLHKECNSYSCVLPQRFGSSQVSFCSRYCCFGDGVSWTMRCSCVLLSSWQTDKNFLRSATGRRELVIFNSPFFEQKVTTCNDIKAYVHRGGQKDRRTLPVPLAWQTPEGPSPEVR